MKKRKKYSRSLYWQEELKKKRDGIAHFRTLLDEQDWFYYQSGDRRVYELGLKGEKVIKELAAGNYIYRIMYEAQKKKIYGHV